MQHLDYHYLFWIPLVAVVIALVATWLFVPESPVRSPGRVNWLGASLLSGWLVAILLGFSQAPTWGWTSPRVVGLFADRARAARRRGCARSRARASRSST